MREVELWTASGFVAVVDVPPFQDSAMPKVVVWSNRVFKLDAGGPGMRWKYAECFAVYSLTPSPGRPREEQTTAEKTIHVISVEGGGGAATCRSCGAILIEENYRMADGCPCTSPRGINHGLVAKETCTCAVCDPEQTGSSCDRRAPVQGDGPWGQEEIRSPGTISWAEHLQVWEVYNKRYPGQSAEVIASRGGFSYWEAFHLTGHELKTWVPR